MKQIRTPKIRGPQIRTPQFLNNLYRDMRDRRLLLPALALLVALIAVPVMLKSSSSSAPPPPSVAGGSDEPTAAQPAVVARQLGVTNYRKRLNALQSKNPFRKHFTELPKSAKLVTSSSLNSSSSSSTTSPSTTSTVPSTSSGSSTTSSSGAISPSGSTGSPQTHHGKPKPFYVKRRIDVEVGPQGDTVKKRGVKQLTFLPSNTTPVVVYLGANEDGTRAYFDVSGDVTSVSGDGRCLPSASDCNFVVLERGELATFDYSPDPGTPYRLKLLAIRNVVSTSLGGRKPRPKRSAGTDGFGDARGSFTPPR